MNPAPISWRETQARSQADLRRLRWYLDARDGRPHRFLRLHPSYVAARLYRISHYLWRRGNGKAARLVSQLDLHFTGFDFHPQCEIGGGLLLVNPAGTSTSGNAGANFTMLPVSGIGMRPDPRDAGAGPGHPVCRDDVIIGPLAGVLGPVVIGDGVRVQAGTPAFRDVPPNMVVVPAVAPKPGNAAEVARIRAELNAPPSHPCDHRCPHGRLRETLKDFGEDVDRYVGELSRHRDNGKTGLLRKLSAMTTTQLLVTGIYRLSHYLHAAGWRRCAMAVARFNFLIHKASINPASCLGGGAFLPHPVGLVINARAGKRLTMYARAICTSHQAAMLASVDEGPVVGDDVIIVAHAAALGPVRLGDNVRVSAGTALCEGVASDSAVASSCLRLKLTPIQPDAPASPVFLTATTNAAVTV